MSNPLEVDRNPIYFLSLICRVNDYFVVIEIAFMDNQAQITEKVSRLDPEKVR